MYCSIQGEWLAIDDQKKNILASLCLASYLGANWLQNDYYAEVFLRRSYFCSYASHTHNECISLCVCVCMCMYVCACVCVCVCVCVYV